MEPAKKAGSAGKGNELQGKERAKGRLLEGSSLEGTTMTILKEEKKSGLEAKRIRQQKRAPS